MIALLNVLVLLINTAARPIVNLIANVGETVKLHCGRYLEYPICENTSRLSNDTDYYPVITNVIEEDRMICECNYLSINFTVIGIYGLQFY